MRNKKSFLAIILFSAAVFVTGCSSDDDSSSVNNGDNDLLMNKWWYDSEDFTADLYFNSNGHYEQKIEMFGNVIESDGDWAWENESTGLMKISNLGGGGQAANEVWFKFSDITEDSMTVKQSVDGGETYSSEVHYIDTNN